MSDVLVIGAGINGLLLSRELAAAGADVCLLDAGQVGREASWAGGGIVSPLYPWRYKPAITALASWAQQFYPTLVEDLISETGIDAQFRQSGLLMLDAADKDDALAWAARYQQNMKLLSAAQCYAREKHLFPGFSEALWMPEVGNVRNPRLCRALHESLLNNSAVKVRENCRVESIETHEDKVAAVHVKTESGARKIKADAVVVTAGAWSRELLRNIGIDMGIEPVKGQMLLYKFPEPPIASIVLHNGRYLIPRQDGHVLIGSTLEYAGFDKQITGAALASLQESASEILPAIKQLDCIGQWAGLRPGTADGVPYIGPVGQLKNLYVNAGQFRNGLVLAPASARLLADLMCNRVPVVDPHPYLPNSRDVTQDA